MAHGFSQKTTQSKLKNGVMPVTNLSELIKSDRHKKWYSQAMMTLAQAEADRVIWNVEFNTLKSHIESGHECIIKQEFEALNSRRDSLTPDEDELRSFTCTSPSRFSSLVKEFKNSKNKLILKFIEERINPMIAVRKRALGLRPYIQKGRRPDPNKAAPYVPKMASHKDMEKVKSTYLELLSDWYPKQVQAYINYFLEVLEDFREAVRCNNKEKVREMSGGYFWMITQSGYGRDPEIKFRPNVNELIKNHAENETKLTQEQFVNKNLSKVTRIVSEKGSLKSTEISNVTMKNGKLAGNIKFVFENGSQFVVRNQVVTVWGRTIFCRFPTTFHNISLPDGTISKMESEEWMNEEYLKLKF